MECGEARQDPRPPGSRVPVVGMVGAGQLARMTAQAAVGLGIGFRVLAAEPGESAAQVCAGVQIGDCRSADDLRAFDRSCDVVTFDHEHVPGPLLAALEQEGHRVRPAREALRYAQDKLAMRQRLAALGVACPRWARVGSAGDVAAFAEGSGWPVVLKAVSGGYDGKGVWVCATPDEAADVLAHGIDLMAEEYVAFERELAVLVARSPHNQAAVYPVVQTVQQDGICREVLAPAPGLAGDSAVAAEQIGLAIAAGIGVTGMLAVELFQTPGGLLVNELAMRPHNSGHWTIEGATTSQFEQHLRAVLDLPLGSPAMAGRHAVMANVLGGDDPDLYGRLIHVMAADPGVKVHLYGKPVKPGRKVGHVTAVGDDVEDLRRRARRAASYLRDGTEQD
ncbi:MAG TPA: 5-(carboxyamino)imidazole ribonucleotide synthase [Streptosporangiaceae bacterium]|nr:5-(carboxyamino)imidazole ribonucleotide synthase [Streptosporangiaceae bacterium]